MERTDGRWDLSVLYSGFDDPTFLADMSRLEEMIASYRDRVEELSERSALDAASAAELLSREEDMWVVGADLYKFTEMTRQADAGSVQAAGAMERLKKICGGISGAVTTVRRWMANLSLSEEDRRVYPILEEYRFYIERESEKGRHLMETPAEVLLAGMEGCAGSTWSDLRAYLTSFAEAEMNGKALTLAQLRGYIHDPDADVRKAAYQAELTCAKSIAGGVCFALNSIKEQVDLLAKARGYGDVMTMTMAQYHMKRETLDAMWDAVREALPKFHAYLSRKAKLLGYNGGLPWYDICAGLGESSAYFTPEDAHAYLIETLGGFAPDMREQVDRAFRENWIDLYARPGKSGGAFCRNLSNQKQSRVLTNFAGDLNSVVTIAHELGHAYHGQMIEGHRPLNRTYTMPVAETASNFNETLVMNAAIQRAEGQERLALLEQRLQDHTQVICDIYSRFLFERAVFAEREKGFIFPERLCELMIQAQKAAFGDSLDPDRLHPYMWINKVHYYSVDMSFYNFPYCFGALLATGLYARYQAEGRSFVEKYRAFLRATTVSGVEDSIAVTGIDVTGKSFWRESLMMITAQIDEFLALTEKQ